MAAMVVVGFAESLSAPEVVWSLADAGFAVAAFARQGNRPALRSSRYVSIFEITPPETSASSALADLQQNLGRLRQTGSPRPLAVMPLDDAAVWLCGRINPELGAQVLGPDPSGTRLALDKWEQIARAREAGFAVPVTRYVATGEEVFSQSVDFPVVFKPVMAAIERGGRLDRGRAWVCADAGELSAAVGKWAGAEPMLLQQFVSGAGQGIFGLAAAQGVIGWSAHRRLRMMNPQGSGSSACVSENVDEGLRAVAERFIAQTGWRGLFMIELLRDEAGNVWFMELNGRAWGSMALARRLGFEYPAWAAKLALSPQAEIRLPARAQAPLVCRHLGRELLHLLFVARGSKSKALARWPSLWTALRQVCSFSRNEGWYNWRADDRRVFINDTITTVAAQVFKPKKRS